MNSALAGRRVLLVEDEMMVAWMLRSMLVALGCAVVGPATRVNRAMSMIEAEAIDVAVLDIKIHGLRSYLIADALVARGIPFVFSTGYQKERLPLGYQRFPLLCKPFAQSTLGNALRQSLLPDALAA
jgi:CheY-like chemotaxis protein